MGWSQSDFDTATPRYLFNAIKGRIRADYEISRLIGYFSSLIHASKPIKINQLGVFSWEKSESPKFSEVDPEAFERIKNFQFPS